MVHKIISLIDKTIIPLTVIFLCIVLIFNFQMKGEPQFTYLAESFLQGRLDFMEQPLTWFDATYFEGKYFWPLGPFPTIMLMPFVWLFGLFDIRFYQGYLSFFLTAGILYLIYKLALSFKYTKTDSLFLAFGFCFATVLVGVAIVPFSWWFAQVLTVLLLILGIYLLLNKPNYLVIGLLCASLLATRPPAALGLLVFALLMIGSKLTSGKGLQKLFLLSFPVAISVLLLALYNYLRFGSVTEQGYTNQILIDVLVKARSYGIFSPVHIPGNLYHLFLAIPLPVFKDGATHVLASPFLKADPWGMSIFVTSPILLYLLRIPYKDRFSKIIWLPVLLTGVLIVTYYGIGFRQYGYRYSLDFLPFLYILLMRNYRFKYSKLTLPFKLILIGSALFNSYLFFTIFK